MKRFAKRPPGVKASWRPCLELLEVRSQPGTVLANPAALLGSDLDVAALTPESRGAGSISLRLSGDTARHLSSLELALGLSTLQASPSHAATQAVQATAPVAHAAAGLSLADQSVAVSASAAHARPVTSAGQKAAAPVQAVAPQTSAVSARVTPLVTPPVAVAHGAVSTEHLGQGGGIESVTGVWASYLGGPTETRLLATAYDTSGSDHPVVVTGFARDTSGNPQLVVARFTANGADAVVAAIPVNGQATGQSVDVDPATGDVYVAASLVDGSGTPISALVHLTADLQTVVFAAGFQGTTAASGDGVRLGTDPSTGNLDAYFTGAVDGNLLVAVFTNLGSMTPDAIGATLNTPSHGYAVTPDAAGNVDVAGQVTDASGNASPVVLQLDPALSMVLNGVQFNSTGPRGALRGIALDAAGNVYATGDFVDPTQSPSALLITAAFDSNLDIPPIYATAAGLVNNADFIGYDARIGPDGNGYFAVTDGDLSSGGGNMAVWENDPAGNNLNYDGPVFGALDDQARGIALDPNTAGNVYLAGFTNSTDFNFTAGTYQPAYGGGAYNGMVINLNVS